MAQDESEEPTEKPAQNVANQQVPFVAGAVAQQMQRGALEFITAGVDASLEHLVAKQNRMRLRHGQSWTTGVSDDGESSGFQQYGTEALLPFDAIVGNDLQAFSKYLKSILEGMIGSLHGSIYKTVGDVSEKVGNVVDAKEVGSFPKAFLEMLRKVEFGVDANGQVSIPSFHMPPAQGAKLLAELEAQGPEFQAEVDRIKREKTDAALERERQRLSKYKS